MRVYCDDVAAFDADDRIGLQEFLLWTRRGHHTLVLEDVEPFVQTTFFASYVAPGDRAEVRELLVRALPNLDDRALDPDARRDHPHAELVPIAVLPCRKERGHPVWEIDPATIGEWVRAGLRLLLENDYDHVLLDVATRVYRRPLVTQAEDQGAIQREPRGGTGEVLNRLRRVDRLERLFVIIDSDLGNPGAVGTHREIARAASELPNVHLLVLTKRELENYVPREVWAASAPKGGHPSRVRAFRRWDRLRDDEKDRVDMETFFPDAKTWSARLADPDILPDAATLERRAGPELRHLLDQLEAWL